MEKIGKQVLVSIIAGVIIYFFLTIYGDINPVIESFRKFNWYFIPILLLLSLINYSIRFIKWDYYLKLLGIKTEKKFSALVFLSGLVMSVTPMKAGELLKSFLLKQRLNVPVSKTAPIIFAERVTDFISLLIIAAAGGVIYNYGALFVGITALFFVGIVLLISNRKVCYRIFSLLERISLIKKYSQKLYNLYESSYLMFRIKPLLLMMLNGLVSWFFECLGFYLILSTFSQDITLFKSSFIYAFATIFGAVTMLPGGLGATEGSLTYLIIQNGLSKENAIAGTLIVRVVTLWFAVFLGMVSLYLYQKKFGRLNNNELNKEL